MGFKLAQPLSSSRSTKSELLLCVFASVQESPGVPTGLRKIHRDIHRHNRVPVLAVMPYWLGPADFESHVIVVVVFLGAVVEFQGRVAVHRPSTPAHQSGARHTPRVRWPSIVLIHWMISGCAMSWPDVSWMLVHCLWWLPFWVCQWR